MYRPNLFDTDRKLPPPTIYQSVIPCDICAELVQDLSDCYSSPLFNGVYLADVHEKVEQHLVNHELDTPVAEELRNFPVASRTRTTVDVTMRHGGDDDVDARSASASTTHHQGEPLQGVKKQEQMHKQKQNYAAFAYVYKPLTAAASASLFKNPYNNITPEQHFKTADPAAFKNPCSNSNCEQHLGMPNTSTSASTSAHQPTAFAYVKQPLTVAAAASLFKNPYSNSTSPHVKTAGSGSDRW
ncbi:hypothetical protein N0V83_008588 [Neocucurbitaria cava]|uniref:Uncharacterized protein n=1 Tax=Neocucurbitaria cava TaxID=798079 RepID=A0A9W8Y0R7_9PLEO|nr:hypothetical protein N0V83_008588 [Neocucurbitaria cava]